MVAFICSVPAKKTEQVKDQICVQTTGFLTFVHFLITTEIGRKSISTTSCEIFFN